ncbi:hypothetical protein BKA67DRAFT_564904 [Truncatella angustata]|uniref:Secreted protein n=1 Tax=Truncatella angustata TaxID=152316 RepID=A0A9P8ULP7_9PEZI|nr:uncharacterized protein BKA67DRAFT_564904 [Truncatella angustata]KAH6654376.1 hypothetical protein BKA67DRAFT_564904 [Truncatella angustata]
MALEFLCLGFFVGIPFCNADTGKSAGSLNTSSMCFWLRPVGKGAARASGSGWSIWRRRRRRRRRRGRGLLGRCRGRGLKLRRRLGAGQRAVLNLRRSWWTCCRRALCILCILCTMMCASLFCCLY